MIVTLSRFLVATTAVVGSLAGCNGASTLAPTMYGAHGKYALNGARRPSFAVTREGSVVRHPNHGASHMAKLPAGQKLLYVSDAGASDVQVYDYPQGGSVGTLTGFSFPQGECTDDKGNVYIVDSGSSQIFEFAHGGTSPIAVFSDTNEFPASCAFDFHTGNLAVTNILGTQSFNQFEIGSISVYPAGSSSPTIYTDPDNAREYFLAYDNNSNLFVDGVDSRTSAFRYAEMSPIGNFTEIKIKGAKITFPGGVQRVGSYFAVGDQEGAVFGTPDIYHVLPTGKVVGRTTLTGANGNRIGDPVQFTIAPYVRKPKKIAVPDAIGAATYIDTWPNGAFLLDVNAGLVAPIAAVISQAPQK